MLDGHQYFRLITPAFLHVGVLHFVLNALCTLRSATVFEQEWGSYGWITAYLLSAIGAVCLSCYLLKETNPDEELGDACQYFRNLYQEGYDCECNWA